ncbi:MAG: prepilin-type N-terminal cleavage/methylation domain-containing protein [Geobacter sp.]|nr:MAG: prepilin-type N-terminal cleavage/methylation domain-containing protein [Geobacter sp.]
MTRFHLKIRQNDSSEKGFTLLELIVTMAIIAIMLGIAMPSYIVWRNNANYRQTGRQITSMLREARSYSIANNVPHSVIARPSNNSYSLLRGATVLQTSFAPTPVLIRGGAGGTVMTDISVAFSSNGTASLSPTDGNISVQDGTNQKFLITVTSTGRISFRQMF